MQSSQIPQINELGFDDELIGDSALRSILRQDPDVIMIGEIRDEETASIAVRAALTGHLVFSTLHTNSAAATISRLADMGIEPFLISSSLLGILAQRLARILCDECKNKNCNYSGYIGRRSIGELLMMNDSIKELLKSTTDEHTIKKELKKSELKTISVQLTKMLLEGETSLDEAIRIGLEHVSK